MTEQPRKRAPRRAAKAAEPPSEGTEQAPTEDAGVQEVNTPPETGDGVQKMNTPQSVKAPPLVQAVGDWHLVTHGTWQISVAPDGLLMLPRHLHPQEWDDFVAAGATAVQVGTDVIAGNGRKAMKNSRTVPRRRAIVTEGDPPEGTVRMNVSQQQASATIGRPRRGQRPANPMTEGRAVG